MVLQRFGNKYYLGTLHEPELHSHSWLFMLATDDFGNELVQEIDNFLKCKHFIGAHVSSWESV